MVRPDLPGTVGEGEPQEAGPCLRGVTWWEQPDTGAFSESRSVMTAISLFK